MRRGDSPARWIARSLALTVLMLTTLFVGTPPAVAQPSIAVEAGFGGQHRSGADLLVQVEIDANRLTSGELIISSRFGERADVVVLPVELAGGARKRFAAVVPSVSQGMSFTVQLVEGGEIVASENLNLRFAQEDELVGVLPSLAANAPATAELAVPLGTAQFAPVTETILAAGPGAIEALGIIVGAGDDLAALSPVAREGLQVWIDGGGDLVVNDGPGPVPGLLANADETRTAIGRGSVRAVSGALSQGSWDGVLFPSPMPQDPFGPGSMTGELTGEMIWFGGPLANTLANDSGFGLPPLGVVLPIMLAYVLIVGPLAFIVLRRIGRPQLLWLALPALAFVFTAGVWIAGSALRSNTTDAHGSVIEVADGSATSRSAILRSSRSGGTTTLELPPSWRPTISEEFRFGPNMGGGTTRLVVDRNSMASDLDAGSFVLLSATGPAPDFEGALVATATSSENATITGTVTNNLDVALEEVVVFAPFMGTNIGTVGAGETVTFVLKGAEANPRFGEPIDMSVWGNSFNRDFGPFGPAPQNDTVVSMEIWANYMSANVGRVREPGTITVAGWTRGLASPLDGSIDQGRTVVIARSDIEAVGTPMTDMASRRTLLRGMEQTGFNQNFGPGFTVTTAWRFDVPEGVDTTLLGLEVPQSVTELEVWNGTDWIELEDVPVGMYELPAGAFIDGSLFVKPTVDFERNPMLGRDFSLHLLTDTNNIRSELLDAEAQLEAAE